MIGWAPDQTATAETQRRDIASAPEIFESVGTIPNVRSLVNRVTSWPVEVKEFVNNVFLTNAPERIRLWELWSIRNDGTSFNTPAQLTITTDIHARPALATDGAGTMWMFFQSESTNGREIFRQRLNGVDAAPVRARAGTSDDTRRCQRSTKMLPPPGTARRSGCSSARTAKGSGTSGRERSTTLRRRVTSFGSRITPRTIRRPPPFTDLGRPISSGSFGARGGADRLTSGRVCSTSEPVCGATRRA